MERRGVVPLAILVVHCLSLYIQLSSGAAYAYNRRTSQHTRIGTKTDASASGNIRRDSYVRIVLEHTSDFCIGRAADSVFYCAFPPTQPQLCGNGSNVEFYRKFVVLDGPEGLCVANINGQFKREANFDPLRMVARLPVYHQTRKTCNVAFVDGKWKDVGTGAVSYRLPSRPQPNTALYQRKTSPWARFTVTAEPNLLCLGRNDSKVLYCSSRPWLLPMCPGANFINFNYEIKINRGEDENGGIQLECYLRNSGYYDMLVDIDSESMMRSLPTYVEGIQYSCVHYSVIDGREKEMETQFSCQTDGRRCRPL